MSPDRASGRPEPGADRSVDVVLIDGSPRGGGRTGSALRAVAEGISAGGARTTTLELAGDLEQATHAVLERAPQADAFVLGSPTYRATCTAELKYLLDRMPRGQAGEQEAPLRARAVALVLTGATDHHFLAVDSLRNMLAGFFGAYVLPGGLYVPHAGFDAGGELAGAWRERAGRLGRALVALAGAIDRSSALSELDPQI